MDHLTAFALLGVVVAVYFGLRRLEAANKPDDSAPDARVLEQVIAYENWSQQTISLASRSCSPAGFAA